jgi:uncharacterized protein involved in response to NO
MMPAVLLAAGFRPFFLAAASWAIIALVLWLGTLAGAVALPSRFDPVAWHAHEMLFGFVPAGIGGFILTAIPNWTKRAPVAGAPLAILVLLWLAGRAVCLVSEWLPAAAATAIDLFYLLALAGIVARELVAAGNRRNFFLVAPLLMLAAGNLLMHLEANGAKMPPGLGWRLGMASVLLLISIIGGRVTPAFTRNWLSARGAAHLPAQPDALDRAAIGALLLAMLLWAFLPLAWPVGLVLLAASALNFARLSRWRGLGTTEEKLLLVLHVGYAWLALGVGMLGASVLTPWVPLSAAVHALTGGAIGTMLLGVMTRAALGHTGGALHADGATIAIYVLVSVAALARVAASFGMPLLVVAGLAWIAAFGLFLLRYGPKLLEK